MMDYENNFLEFMVKHERTNNELINPVVIISAMVCAMFILTSVLFAYLPAFAPYLIIVMLFVFFNVSKMLITNTKLEFEYILTEGELDIDKIINRNSRKTILTFKCSDIIAMNKIGNDMDAYKQTLAKKPKKVFANGPIVSKETYYALLPGTKNPTPVLLLFDPPQKLVDAMKKYNSENILC